jgi:hypothetical protein
VNERPSSSIGSLHFALNLLLLMHKIEPKTNQNYMMLRTTSIAEGDIICQSAVGRTVMVETSIKAELSSYQSAESPFHVPARLITAKEDWKILTFAHLTHIISLYL